MLQNPCKTLGFKKNMVYKIPPGGGGGKPYPASGLQGLHARIQKILPRGSNIFFFDKGKEDPNSTKSGSSSARQRNAI